MTPARSPRVFLPVSAPSYDPSAALKFGEILTLIERAPHFLNVSDIATEALAAAQAQGYDPDVDSLAITGPLTPVAVVCSSMLAHYGRLRILVWDSRANQGRGEYRDRLIYGAPAGART